MKGNVTISLDFDLINHLQKKKEKEKFNFSKWITKKYKEEFMTHGTSY